MERTTGKGALKRSAEGRPLEDQFLSSLGLFTGGLDRANRGKAVGARDIPNKRGRNLKSFAPKWSCG